MHIIITHAETAGGHLLVTDRWFLEMFSWCSSKQMLFLQRSLNIYLIQSFSRGGIHSLYPWQDDNTFLLKLTGFSQNTVYHDEHYQVAIKQKSQLLRSMLVPMRRLQIPPQLYYSRTPLLNTTVAGSWPCTSMYCMCTQYIFREPTEFRRYGIAPKFFTAVLPNFRRKWQ